MKVLIYVPPSGRCRACTALKNIFKEIGVDFDTKKVNDEYKKRKEYKRHGASWPHVWTEDDKRYLFSGCPPKNTLQKSLPGLMAESKRRR